MQDIPGALDLCMIWVKMNDERCQQGIELLKNIVLDEQVTFHCAAGKFQDIRQVEFAFVFLR